MVDDAKCYLSFEPCKEFAYIDNSRPVCLFLLYTCDAISEQPFAICTMTQHEKVVHGNEKEMQSRANQLVSLRGSEEER